MSNGRFTRERMLGNKNTLGMAPWNKGKKGIYSKETIEKMVVARTGKKHSEETKSKIGLKKEKNPNWKGGIDSKTRVKNAPYPSTGQCEVCGCIGKMQLDHDHETEKFRGWLCIRCNVALGMVKDNTETLIALSEYLIKSRL